MKLQNLEEIFQDKVFRIPDYQRGFAWKAPQVQDFWDDLISLPEGRMHYTGLITLEPIKAADLKIKTEGANWLESEANHKFYYVVDGQQRLTTFVILIQAILARIEDKNVINDAKNKYVRAKTNNNEINKFYKFGYDSDESSQSFLAKEIFKDTNHLSQNNNATIYTINIKNAYDLFIKNIDVINLNNNGQLTLKKLYERLTKNILFNIFETTKDIDIFVTFETMNNRGKSLTNLELLKNRLIYLTSLFSENSGKETVRKNINIAWKTIYSYLGRNPNKELNDDIFLKNHWIMNFNYTRNKGDDYIKDLLNLKFSRNSNKENLLSNIQEYVISLQHSVKWWFILHNPRFDNTSSENPLTEKHKKLLDRLNRLGYKSFRPLLMACFLQKHNKAQAPSELISPTDEEISDLLIACERYNFLVFNVSQRRSNTGDSRFYSLARKVLTEEANIKEITTEINNWVVDYYSYENFKNIIKTKYRDGRPGFYNWDGLRYFLYEYNIFLNQKSNQPGLDDLPDWPQFVKPDRNNETIEHIYPQNPNENPDCKCQPQCTEQCSETWSAWYKNYDNDQKGKLLHSLGNLVPLSRSKNSSLRNIEFNLKVKSVQDTKTVGFFNGSAAENEIAQELTWQDKQILTRGLKLLDFLEDRWQVPEKMTAEQKTNLLQLDFVPSPITL